MSNPLVRDKTGITLFAINHATLMQWYTKRTRQQEQDMLVQNIRLAEPPMVARTPLPPVLVRDPVTDIAPVPPHQQYKFVLPPYTVGISGRVRECRILPCESPANPESQFQRTPMPVPVIGMLTPSVSVSTAARSTECYRRKQQKKKAAGELVRQYNIRRPTKLYTCQKCGQSRTKETHKQYYGHWYCALTATESFEDWSASKKCRLEKKQQQRIDT